jgi:hypothetical protein
MDGVDMQEQMVLELAQDIVPSDKLYWYLTSNNDNPVVPYTLHHLFVRYQHSEWRVFWWSDKIKDVHTFNSWLAQWYIGKQPQLELWQIKFLSGHNRESSTLEYIKKWIEHEV